MTAKPKKPIIHVTGTILAEIEALVRFLEAQADTSAVTGGYFQRAANYLRLIFPPGHPLFRTPFVRRTEASAEGYAAESLVIRGRGHDERSDFE
jgi:hypothetical protein